MKVVLTQTALEDLEQIGDHIAAESPERALEFVDELQRHCEGLANMPQAYPLVPRYEIAGLRRRVFGNYLIFYRVSNGTVEVLHILHGARDIDALLFPTD